MSEHAIASSTDLGAAGPATVDREAWKALIGSALGYALHMKDGRLIFSVRTATDRITDVQSEPIRGAVTIKASFAKDGTLTLTVGDQKAVTAKAPGPIPRQPQEDFCVGLDNGQPVASYSKGKPFAGTISDLSVTVPSK